MWKWPPPGFMHISRGHAIAGVFLLTRRSIFVHILQEPVKFCFFRRSQESHFLSIFCVITSIFLISEKIAKSENLDIYDDPRWTRSLFWRSFFTKSHFLSIFCVRTLFFKKSIFCMYLQCFSQMGIREIFWGHFGHFDEIFFRFLSIFCMHTLIFRIFDKKTQKQILSIFCVITT